MFSVMAGNHLEMLAAHYAVPSIGVILNSIHIRLDSPTEGCSLKHVGSKLLFYNLTSAATAKQALDSVGISIRLFSENTAIDFNILNGREIILGDISLKIGDERAPITLNYTSGTTDNLKRLVIHHCGAYLNSLGNVFNLGFKRLTKYLWTPPMLHCNEWYHTWAVTAAGGTNFCLDQANPALIVKALQEQEITHFSYAPLNVAG